MSWAGRAVTLAHYARHADVSADAGRKSASEKFASGLSIRCLVFAYRRAWRYFVLSVAIGPAWTITFQVYFGAALPMICWFNCYSRPASKRN